MNPELVAQNEARAGTSACATTPSAGTIGPLNRLAAIPRRLRSVCENSLKDLS